MIDTQEGPHFSGPSRQNFEGFLACPAIYLERARTSAAVTTSPTEGSDGVAKSGMTAGSSSIVGVPPGGLPRAGTDFCRHGRWLETDHRRLSGGVLAFLLSSGTRRDRLRPDMPVP